MSSPWPPYAVPCWGSLTACIHQVPYTKPTARNAPDPVGRYIRDPHRLIGAAVHFLKTEKNCGITWLLIESFPCQQITLKNVANHEV